LIERGVGKKRVKKKKNLLKKEVSGGTGPTPKIQKKSGQGGPDTPGGKGGLEETIRGKGRILR